MPSDKARPIGIFRILRPVMFLHRAETAHHLGALGLRLMFHWWLIPFAPLLYLAVVTGLWKPDF